MRSSDRNRPTPVSAITASVLVPGLTFVATAIAVLSAGPTPMVADVDADSWLLTPAVTDAARKRERI